MQEPQQLLRLRAASAEPGGLMCVLYHNSLTLRKGWENKRGAGYAPLLLLLFKSGWLRVGRRTILDIDEYLEEALLGRRLGNREEGGIAGVLRQGSGPGERGAGARSNAVVETRDEVNIERDGGRANINSHFGRLTFRSLGSLPIRNRANTDWNLLNFIKPSQSRSKYLPSRGSVPKNSTIILLWYARAKIC